MNRIPADYFQHPPLAQSPDCETADALLEDAVNLSARVAAQVERRRWDGERITPKLIAKLQARVAQLRKIVE